MRNPKPWFRKANSCWYVCIGGKQVKLGTNEKKARAKFERMLTNGVVAEHTVRQIIDAYWLWMKKNLAQSTCDRRQTILQSFSDSVPATLKAGALRAFHVQKWIDSCKRVKSPTTAGDYVTRIKAAMTWAVGMGYAEDNPIKSMPKPAARVRQEFIPADAWEKALALATDVPFLDYLTVMLASGARPSEMHTFEAKHIVGERFILPIERSKGRKKSRVVYLPAEAMVIIKRLAKEHPTGKLFRNSKGNPWNKDNIRCRFRRLKRELKMPELCATTLRHSFAHYRLTKGQDALTVSKLMGHSDTRMLALRYGHLDANIEYMSAAANGVAFPAKLASSPLV